MTTRILRGYFLIAVLQGGLILLTLLQIPTDAKNRFLFGFSALRLGIAAGVILAMLAFAWLALETWRISPWFTRLISTLERQIKRQRVWAAVAILLVAGVLAGSYLLLLTAEISEPFARAYFERLAPLILWATLLSLQTLIALPALRHGADVRHYFPQSRTYRWALAIFGLVLAFGAWIAWSGIGFEPDATGWNALGTPLLETQLFLAWGASLMFLAFTTWLAQRSKVNSQDENKRAFPGANFDLLVCLLLWIGASIYWWSIPLPDSWFVTEPTAPNFEFYPNSDALIYDTTGQSILVGERFKSWDLPFPRRPMYALLLAFLNFVGNQEYETVILGQIILLALFPVVLYLLTRKLSNRFVGFMVAILAILREGNAIKLSGNLTISHSKLLMSDFPAALGVALFTYLIIAWLHSPDSRRMLPLISGGVLGAFMLVRPEVAVLLFVVFIVISGGWYRRPIYLSKKVLLIFAGILLVLSPWIWRNWELTGEIFLDSPDHRIDLFIERFNIPSNQSESGYQIDPAGFNGTVSINETVNSPVIAASIPLIKDDLILLANKIEANMPGDILAFIRAHYVHSQVQSVLYLPDAWRLPDTLISYFGHKSLPKFFEECCSARNYVRRLPYWNQNWQGDFLQQSIIPVLINLFLVSLGLR
ncbi:MAG TPA: glycosyltransferase family 39 protein, partial [Anaerolineales bacterium]